MKLFQLGAFVKVTNKTFTNKVYCVYYNVPDQRLCISVHKDGKSQEIASVLYRTNDFTISLEDIKEYLFGESIVVEATLEEYLKGNTVEVRINV